jgi:hypothetical protein
VSDSVTVENVQREGLDHLSNDPRVAPRPNQPFTEMFDLVREQQAAADPDEPEPWATLTAIPAGTWRFVTIPGIGGTAIRLDIPVETDDRDESVRRKNKYTQRLDRWERQGKIAKTDRGKDGLLKADQAVYEIVGTYNLNFTPVRDGKGKRFKQAEFTTDDPTVAAYIRARLNRGDFPEIVEDVRPVMVEMNGELVEMMPVTEAGKRRVAMAAAAAG